MMRRYSHSALRNYDACPLQHKLQRAGADEDLPPWLLMGRYGHEVIETYLLDCHSAHVPSDAALIDPILEDLDTMPVAIEDDVRAVCLQFAAAYVVDLHDPNVEAKYAFDRDWNKVAWKDESARFRAVLDLIDVLPDGTVVITDWKLGWRVPSKADAEAEGQLHRYAFIASLLYPEAIEFRMRLHYARANYAHEWDVHRDELGYVREDLERRMDAIDADDTFEATPGDHCEKCFQRRSCQKYRDAGFAAAIPGNTAELAAEYHLVKAKLADLNTALRARIESEGPLEQPGGKVLGFQNQEQVKIVDVQDAVNDLRMNAEVAGADIWAALSLSKTAAEKLLRKAGRKELIPEFLAEHGQVTVKSVFKSHKPKGGGA
jgi:RecB family exonuclease